MNPFCLLSADTVFKIPSLYSFYSAVGEPTGASGGDYLFKDPINNCEVDADSVDLYDMSE